MLCWQNTCMPRGTQRVFDGLIQKSLMCYSNGASSQDECEIYKVLLRKCLKFKSITEGKHLHKCIKNSRLHQTTFLANLLMQMYGNCDSLENVDDVFHEMELRNVFSWNIRLSMFASNGHLVEAETTFELMPARNVVSWNAMLTAYSLCGKIKEAKAVFVGTPENDVTSWSAMISAYTRNRHPAAALNMYQRMNLEGVQFSKLTLINTLDACADLAVLTKCKLVHDNVVETEFQYDIAVSTAVLKMYGRCGCVAKARSIFEEMLERDLITWTALLTAYSHNLQLVDAMKAFEKAPWWDAVLWTTMIAAYSQTGQTREAWNIFHRMPHKDVLSWTAIIQAYVLRGQQNEALEVFREMDLDGAQPNSLTLTNILDTCAALNALTVGRAIHACLIERGLKLNEMVGNTLIHMYGACGKLEEAQSVFNAMFFQSRVSWTALIAAYARNGCGKIALQLFKSVEQQGLEADEILFVSVLNACSHTGELSEGICYFKSLVTDRGIVPTLDHYCCMIDMFGRNSQLNDAEELANNMPFFPDIIVWTILLGACRLNGDRKRAEGISKLVIDFNLDEAGTYSLVS